MNDSDKDDPEMGDRITSLDEHRERVASDDSGDDPVITKRKRPPKRNPHTRDPGSQIRRLKCFNEVDEMLRQGAYVRRVVHFIQQEREEMLELSHRAIMFLVREHRKYLFSDEAVLEGEAVSKVDEDDPFYELHSMQVLYREMEARIKMEVATEKKLTKLFSTTHKEFLVAAKMSAQIMDLKKDLGLLNKERGSVRQRVGSGTAGRLDIAEVVAQPESRQKVLGFVEALIGNPELMEEFAGEQGKLKKTPKSNRAKRVRRPSQASPGKR